jgi:hypothetical protein
VSHSFAFVNYIDHGDPAELPGIERLATGGGVKGGSIEIDPARIVRAARYGRLEFADVRVGIIKSMGHQEPGNQGGG